MNICSEHHEIKRKIGRIIVRILIKNCKRYFSLTKISVLYMFLKHDPKLWSLRKVLPNVSTVFGIWMKARIKHTEVFLVFFVWGFFFCFFFIFDYYFFFVRCKVDIPVRLLTLYLAILHWSPPFRVKRSREIRED